MTTITENQDAAPDIAGAQYELALGDTFEGTFENNEDVDLVRVELSADTIYDIRLTAEDGTDSFLEDYTKRVEVALYDSAGREVRAGADMPKGSVLILRPPATGTYYLKAHAPFQGVSGNYEIDLIENTIPVGTYDELASYMLEDYYLFWAGDSRSSATRKLGRTGADGAVTVTVNIDALDPPHQALAREALAAWEDVSGIRFEEVGPEESPDMPFRHVDGNTSYGGADGVQMSRIAVLYVYLHEIGHALGLGHPGAYPAPDAPDDPSSRHHFGAAGTEYLIDSTQATIMSYIASSGNTFIAAADSYSPVTPMVADIIAIQALYGEPVEGARPGDTVYGYQSNAGGHLGEFFTLWTGEGNPLVDVHVGAGSTPTLVDLDNDGDLDLVVHGWEDGTGIEYHENTGGTENPVFVQREGDANPFEVVGAYTFGGTRFADLDGDGDLDLVLSAFTYFENVGTADAPDFAQRTGASNPLEALRALDAGTVTYPVDIDNDGDMDFVIPDYNPELQQYHFNYAENTGDAGTPAFTLRDGGANPFADIASSRPSVAFADLDNDDDLDLIVSQGADGAVDVHENTGSPDSPAFTDAAGEDDPFLSTANLYGEAAALGDLDGDNDLDLIVGRYDGTVSYLVNTGTPKLPEYQLTHYTNSANTGPGLTLYDTGGTDTLDLRTDHDSQHIDLRPEGISSVYGARGNLVIARGTVIENAVAGHGDDTVIGNGADNALDGRTGNDLLWGSGGDDLLTGGPGADRLVGGADNDTASWSGSPEAVTVRLHSFATVGGDAQGDSFPYTVDVAYTDADGVEQIESLPDVENLIGSAHNDILAGDRRDNRLRGGDGDDTLYGGPGGGDDRMLGGPGNDRLFGGQGTDTLTGGPGDDRLAGGPGNDVFVFGPGDGADTVTDFGNGTDRIDLRAFDIDSVDAVSMTAGDDGVTLDLPGPDGGTVLLAGLDASLSADDFIV